MANQTLKIYFIKSGIKPCIDYDTRYKKLEDIIEPVSETRINEVREYCNEPGVLAYIPNSMKKLIGEEKFNKMDDKQKEKLTTYYDIPDIEIEENYIIVHEESLNLKSFRGELYKEDILELAKKLNLVIISNTFYDDLDNVVEIYLGQYGKIANYSNGQAYVEKSFITDIMKQYV